MFTGPVGPVEVFFYWPEAVLGNFYWPGAIGSPIASSPVCRVHAKKSFYIISEGTLFSERELLLLKYIGKYILD